MEEENKKYHKKMVANRKYVYLESYDKRIQVVPESSSYFYINLLYISVLEIIVCSSDKDLGSPAFSCLVDEEGDNNV